jgi:hypothetical protein
MIAHAVTLIGYLTSVLAITHSPTLSPTLSPSSIQTCSADNTSEIVLGALLGVSLTGIIGTCLIRRNIHHCHRVFTHNGDPERVYDTPCAYCGKKQPADCMREHISECAEHLKHWAPKLASQRHLMTV